MELSSPLKRGSKIKTPPFPFLVPLSNFEKKRKRANTLFFFLDHGKKIFFFFPASPFLEANRKEESVPLFYSPGY